MLLNRVAYGSELFTVRQEKEVKFRPLSLSRSFRSGFRYGLEPYKTPLPKQALPAAQTLTHLN